MIRIVNVILTGLCVGLWAAPALAADLAPAAEAPAAIAPVPALGFLSEVRGGIFAHDPWSPESGGGADLNLEVLSVRPFRTADPSWEWLVPRVQVGGTFNFTGRTSTLYAGLAWTYDITQAIFVEGTFGGSLNNGESDATPGSSHSALGCTALFRESASLGYRITANWSVMATVEHNSNAGLCNNNRGLTNAGIRVGYTF